jgi:hypothetical protein
MVGGLIQDEQLTFCSDHLGERHPLGLTTGKLGDMEIKRIRHREPINGGFSFPARSNDFSHCRVRKVGLLSQRSDPDPSATANSTSIWFQVTGNDPKECRLSRSIDANDANTVAMVHGE